MMLHRNETGVTIMLHAAEKRWKSVHRGCALFRTWPTPAGWKAN